ncbi:SAM-dependent methyltransferase [Rhodanobacter glycinis]|uniref:class I SAM-dependent methyltransferase n=1 Tax=Rhodanobacter glycinis TaxID=582702 RepID=UPI00112E95C3|nr:class I SAM-dependent methyltransferase [Rhodanobacter glycinis]TPG48687.1 SAM-dependent methyltransferase [Rhodanobacter glycinis]
MNDKRLADTIDSEFRREGFQPISVKPAADHPYLFWLRCVVDLQLGTIVKNLRPALAQLTGRVLDVGAGQSPWRAWLPRATSYQGLDVGNAHEFGMDHDRPDIVYYDGKLMPFDDSTFDSALCIEVLEHSEDPQLLIAEIARVIKSKGTLLLTVPWSARLHHLPHDYHRFARGRLQALLMQAGFDNIEIRERGNDVGAIANKLTVLTIRLFRPDRAIHMLWGFPLGLICAVLAAAFIVAAHCSDALAMGSREDPLGYFVRATRNRDLNPFRPTPS